MWNSDWTDRFLCFLDIIIFKIEIKNIFKIEKILKIVTTSKYMIQEFFSSDDIFENCLHTRDLIRQELIKIFEKELNSKNEHFYFLKRFFPNDPEIKTMQRQIEQIKLFMKLL